jgi:predicted nucleic acid-binding protein
MKNLFLDTNIIIDFLLDRQPFHKLSYKIFKDASEKKVQLFTSSHSILTAHYLLKKHVQGIDLREILFKLIENIVIIPVDIEVLKKGLKSNFKDFEDAVQIHCAYKIENIDCIITRDSKDFKGCEILVISPDQY